MKKSCALLLLVLSASLSINAYAAQWARVSNSASSSFYIDKGSIIKVDRARKVWSLQSFSQAQTTPEGKPYRSVKALHLYSCDDRTTVLLSQVFYPEAMGKGEPVENYKYEKFSPEDIVPDSPYDNALSAICKMP